MTTSPRPAGYRPWLVVVVALLALGAGILAAASGTSRQTTEVTWDSSRDGNPAAVSLVDPRPGRLLAAGISTGAGAASLLSTFSGVDEMRVEVPRAHLDVVRDEAGISVRVVSVDEGVLASSPPIGGVPAREPIEWRLDYADGTARLTAGGESTEVSVPDGRLLVLNWLESSAASPSSVRVVVQSSGVSEDRPVPAHSALIVLCLLLVVAALLLSGEIRIPGRLRWRTPRVKRADILVGLGIVVAGFTASPHYDDGWYLARSRLLMASGWSLDTPLSDPFWGGNPQPQGFLYESLLGATFAQSSIVIVIRLLPMLLGLAAWLLISRRILPRLGRAEPALLVAGGFVALWSVAWMTLRPEVAIALLSALLLALFPRRSGSRIVAPIAGFIGLAALGVSTHQTGLILPPAAAIAVVVVMMRPGASWSGRIAGLTLGLALGLALGFVNQNLTLALEDIRSYDALSAHGFGPLEEWVRIAELMRIGSSAQRAYFLLGVAGLLALWLVTARRLLFPRGRPEQDLFLLAASAMPFGLLFTSSKWGWHYASLLVPFTVGLVLLARVLARSPRGVLARFVVAGGLLVVTAFAVRSPALDSAWARPAILVVLVLVAASLFAPRPRLRPMPRYGLAMTSVTVVLLGTVVAGAAITAAHSTSGWSFLKQTTLGLVDADARCGAIAATGHLGSPDGPTGRDLLDSGASITVGPGQYLYNPCVRIWTRTGGLWNTVKYSIEWPNWLLSNLPAQPPPAQACIDHEFLDRPGTYPSCTYEILPAGVPQAGGNPA